VTAGLRSGRARDIQAGPYDDFLQTDAAINRGHSGGPLFNADGKVVGVNTAILSPTGGSIGISFAIPSSTAKSIVAQLRETGSVRRGQLGVHIQPVTTEIAQTIGRKDTHGAMVASVVEDSPAAIAGLQPGDVIVQYEGKDIESFRQLPRMVAATEIGRTAAMKVWRDTQMIERKAKITELETPRVSKTDKPPEDKPEISSERATLGMLLEPISEALRLRLGLDEDAKGVLVTGVVPDSPAARQGIKAGDIISEFDKKPVKSPDDVAQRVTETKKDGRASALVRINRSGAFRFVALPV
jgi:serine protease Do